MTDQRDKAIVAPGASSGDVRAEVAAPASISRRALIRGASVALPTILTLNSNAAFGWAVTSGTIGSRAADSTATGDAICIVRGTPAQGGKSGVYDVNLSDFYRVRGDLYYRTGSGGSGTLLNAEKACEYTGTELYYRTGTSGSGTRVTPLQGAVASLTNTGAMASFSANVPAPDWPTF